jgi:hypothetical protein
MSLINLVFSLTSTSTKGGVVYSLCLSFCIRNLVPFRSGGAARLIFHCIIYDKAPTYFIRAFLFFQLYEGPTVSHLPLSPQFYATPPYLTVCSVFPLSLKYDS